MIVLADVEANGLNPDTIHCIVVKELDGSRHTFLDTDNFDEWVMDTEQHHTLVWVFHNGLAYDVPVINKLTHTSISPSKVIDTSVVSKLRNYKQYRTHSLKEIGEDLGVYKGDYDGGWDICTPEMVAYCEQDVEVLEAIYKDQEKFINSSSYKDALRLEHDVAWLCHDMSSNGFPFDEDKAQDLLKSIKKEKEVLEESFKSILEDKLVLDRTLKMRYNKDGTMNKRCAQAIVDAEKYEIDGDDLHIYAKRQFNPGSPKQCIDVMWDYGWKPVEKTKGHIQHERKSKRPFYGPR